MTTWQFTPVAPLYIAAVGISWLVSYMAWNMRPVRGATHFSLMTFFGGVWALGYLLGFFNTNMSWKLIMLRVEYTGTIGTSLSWLLFVAVYTYFDEWLTRRALVVILIVPAATLLMILTVQWHDLFYHSFELATENDLIVTDKVYNIGFYLWVGYAYFLTLAGAMILLRAILRMPERFRGQFTPLVLVVVVVVFPNVLYITGNNPLFPYDPTPLSFVIVGVLLIYIIRRYRFLDVVPVAYNLVFENANSGIIIVDKRGHILDMNKAAEKIGGRAHETVLGKSIFDAFPDHQELIERFRDVDTTGTEVEIGPDSRSYELQITPLSLHSGGLAGRIIMLYDITERKRTLNELDAYAHTVAHDLKAPMAAIIGYINLIEDMKGDDDTSIEELWPFLDTISRYSDKMLSIVDELLLLASVRKLDEIELTPLKMDVIVHEVQNRLSHAIMEAKAEVISTTTWPVALGYAPWVEEIWVNYLSNAIKYGGEPPCIELGANADSNGMIRFWVRDNGAGLTSEQQEQLFTQFTRLDLSRTDGHGLGLSIVHRIVERLGGQVGVESTVGQGSTFFFTLPEAD